MSAAGWSSTTASCSSPTSRCGQTPAACSALTCPRISDVLCPSPQPGRCPMSDGFGERTSAKNEEGARAQFVLVDVGCIECGESTEVLAVFTDESAGREAFMARCALIGEKPQLDYGWPLYAGYFTGGQRSLELH